MKTARTFPRTIEILEARVTPSALGLSPAALFQKASTVDVSDDGERIAPRGNGPTISGGGKTASFVDVDGDTFNITTNIGTFSQGNFVVSAGGQLQRILVDSATSGSAFQGASITVTLTGGGGDGFVNIGAVNAKGIDLKSFKTIGDLGQIDVGDADFGTAALGTFKAFSIGALGLSTQGGTGDLVSKIKGTVTTIKIGAFVDGFINVKSGSIGTVLMGSADASGSASAFAATVRADGYINTVIIGGNLRGGVGAYSGDIWSRTGIGSVFIGGSVIGGRGLDSGAIFAGSPDGLGGTAGNVESVTIGGNLIGSSGMFSGTIYSDSYVSGVNIAGFVKGGSGYLTGAIVSNGGMGFIAVQGAVTGGLGTLSGSIAAFGGTVESIVVRGAFNSGGGAQTGIFVDGILKSASLTKASGIVITALGDGTATPALGSLITSGTVKNSLIATGYDSNLTGLNSDASIGSIRIGGNLKSTSIVASVSVGNDGIFGTFDDALLPGDTTPGIIARISSIVINGNFIATGPTTDLYTIAAQQLDGLTFNGSVAAFNPGPNNDFYGQLDYLVREVA